MEFIDCKKFTDSIFSVLYNDKDYGIWTDGGTAFIISGKKETFIVTAKHCIKGNWEDLCFVNLGRKYIEKIPLDNIFIGMDDKEKTNDFALLKTSTNKISKIVSEKVNQKEILEDLKNDKRFNKLKKPDIKSDVDSYIKDYLDVLKKYKSSKLRKDFQAEGSKYVQTSLYNIRPIKWKKEVNFKDKEKLIVIGYPKYLKNIDHENKTIYRNAVQIECEYIELYDKEEDIHKIRILEGDKDHEKLVGLSGSPVFSNNIVVGVIIRASNGFMYFISTKFFHKIINEIENKDL